MPSFAYKAIAQNGESISGTIEAADRKQVVQQLFARNYKPVAINQRDQEQTDITEISYDFFKSERKAKPKLKLPGGMAKKNLSLHFSRKLLELLTSGMPLGDAVKLLSMRLTDPEQKGLAETLWRDLSEGRTLAASMASHKDIFDDSSVHLVEAGEATGNLVPILERIVSYKEESAELRSKILTSLAYPVFICLVAFGVVGFFLFFLLPKIENMLQTLGGEMQILAKVLIGGSNFTVNFGPFIVLGLALGIVVLGQWRKTPAGREKTDFWLLRLPFIGRIFLYSEIYQATSLMATLMESGINTTETLRLAERTLTNTQLRAKFRICRRQIQEGASLASVFRQTYFMPDIAIDILTVGENTGNIVNSLREITKMNRRDLTNTLSFLTGFISSAALVFAFILVAMIALSIIFSVLGISQTLTI